MLSYSKSGESCKIYLETLNCEGMVARAMDIGPKLLGIPRIENNL